MLWALPHRRRTRPKQQLQAPLSSISPLPLRSRIYRPAATKRFFYNRTLSYSCQRGLQNPRNFAVWSTYTLISGSQPPMTCVVEWRAPGSVADMLPKNIQASCMHEWNFCYQILVKRQETEFPFVQQKPRVHSSLYCTKQKKLSLWQWCLSCQMH